MPRNTIAEYLLRFQDARTDIGTAITTDGGTVITGDGLEDLPTDVATIVPPINTAVEAANTSLETILSNGGIPFDLIEKTITTNGTYIALDEHAEGYSKVTINVPQVLPDNALAPIFTNNVSIITGNVEGGVISGNSI